MDIIGLMKREMFRRKLSNRTIITYLFYVNKFLLYCRKEPKGFSKKDVCLFLDKCMEKGLSGSTINVAHNALRFMMTDVLRKSMRINIRYSKTPKTLPVFLSREEMRSLLGAIRTPRHKLMVSLMYGAGLRVSELLNLKIEDVNVETGIGWVRHGKGNKDRPFIIADSLKQALSEAAVNSLLNHTEYLFFTPSRLHLSVASVQNIVKNAAKRAGIKKNVHPHTLRHSFATHLIEKGNDIILVQALLGHNEARTTMQYLHTASPSLFSARSPLDDL